MELCWVTRSQPQRYNVSMYATFSKWENYRDEEQSGGCQGLEDDGQGGGYDYKRVAWDYLW